MKNILEHFKTKKRFVENELLNERIPVSTKIKREAQLDCYNTIIREIERILK